MERMYREIKALDDALNEAVNKINELDTENRELKEENRKLKERLKKIDDQAPKLEKHLTLLNRLIKYWRGKYERYKKEMVPYLFCKTDCYPKFRPEDYWLVGKDWKLVLIEDANF